MKASSSIRGVVFFPRNVVAPPLAIVVMALLACSGSPPAAAQMSPEDYQHRLAIQRQEPAPPLTSGPGVTAQDVRITSKILGREMRYRALLPAGYASSERYYPVLYLLHGTFNPYYEWEKQSSLAALLARDALPLIVVLPQFDNSYYLNAAETPGDRYMSYFFGELLPDVESRFRARSEPPARAIAGVSMGGYGAMLYALRFPQAFSFAASFSGAMGLMEKSEEYAKVLSPFPLEKVIGPAGSATRGANDLYALAKQADPAALPPLWLTAGDQDFVLEENLELFRLLQQRGANVELHALPGEHQWAFWDAQLPEMLTALRRALRLDRP